MDEAVLRRILSLDLSAGTEAFRDELLARCLAVLDKGAMESELADDELEWLAAAGDPSTADGSFWDNGGAG